MVAPLVAGAARAAAGTARSVRAARVSVGNAGRSSAIAGANGPSDRILYGGRLERDLRKVKENGVLYGGRQERQLRKVRQRGVRYGGRVARDFRSRARAPVGNTMDSVMEMAKAVRASWVIGAFVLSFYPIHLIFGFIQIAGYATEYAGEQLLWGLGALVMPGQTVFAAGFIMTTLFGIASMFIAAFMYMFQNVRCWRGHGLFFFMICTVMCFVPMLNIFPWLVPWMFAVIYAQKR